MNSLPAVHDIRTYLVDAGWQRHEETWHGASIWSNTDGRQILVPATNELADTRLRIAELLSVLTAAEKRPAAEIVTDINKPLDDIQWYRTVPDDGYTSLDTGLRTLQSVRKLISAAARTVVSGALPTIPRGEPPEPVGQLLQQIELGPNNPADRVITVRIPLAAPSRATEDGPAGKDTPPDAIAGSPLGRRVGYRLRAAVFAAQSAAAEAASHGDLAVFDDSVAAGVSADLCEALIGLAGGGRDQPFEITFRWGRGLPSDVPAGSVRFPSGTADAMRAGAKRLRRLDSVPPPPSFPPAEPGTATMAGLVKSLHGQSSNGGWLINVRGYLTANGGTGSARTVRVLLGGQAAYDRAIAAHRSENRVRARGVLSGNGRNAELHVNDDDFEILQGDALPWDLSGLPPRNGRRCWHCSAWGEGFPTPN